MSKTNDFKVGQNVTFRPGPKATSDVTAPITAIEDKFLVTKDSTGKVRKVRPGAARAA